MTPAEVDRSRGADLVARGAGCAMLVLAGFTSVAALTAAAISIPSFVVLGPVAVVASLIGLGLVDRGAHRRLLRLAIGVGLLLAAYFAVGALTETTEGGVNVGALFAVFSLVNAGYAGVALAEATAATRRTGP